MNDPQPEGHIWQATSDVQTKILSHARRRGGIAACGARAAAREAGDLSTPRPSTCFPGPLNLKAHVRDCSLGGAAASPLAARAQQADRVRSIGVIVPLVEGDAFARAQISAFVAALQQAGWTDGHNARIQVRRAGPTPSDIRRHAAELVPLRPDVVLAYGSPQ
jgi:hypothetical protein